MNKKQAEYLKTKAQDIERSTGLREFGDCPVCDDMIFEDKTGTKKCVYCDWNSKLSAVETCEMFNRYWKVRNVKSGYERFPKKPEDFQSYANQAFQSFQEELSTPLKVVLDFVERWNKQDAEKEVAEAAQKLTKFK